MLVLLYSQDSRGGPTKAYTSPLPLPSLHPTPSTPTLQHQPLPHPPLPPPVAHPHPPTSHPSIAYSTLLRTPPPPTLPNPPCCPPCSPHTPPIAAVPPPASSPRYGADTPLSFFDPTLPWGWNLNNLGDLLQTCPALPTITGGCHRMCACAFVCACVCAVVCVCVRVCARRKRGQGGWRGGEAVDARAAVFAGGVAAFRYTQTPDPKKP